MSALLTKSENRVANAASEVEDMFWEELDMESFGRKLRSGEYSPTKHAVMGTGRTANACEMCGNSLKTHGCGGCQA